MGKIHVPTIWIPRWYDVGIEVGIGLRGELTWELIETRRFRRPVVVRRGKQSNLIVNAGLNGWISYYDAGITAGPLVWTTGKTISVGTGTAAPDVTQTSLQAELASATASTISYDTSVYPPYAYCSASFNESMANGDLTEWGVRIGTTLWCRELFRDDLGNPVVVTKTSTQILVLTYRLYMQRAVDSTTTQLTAAGTTYTCVSTMNNAQINNILQYGSYTKGARVGTSNAASDLINDTGATLHGTQLFGGNASTSELFASTYVPGTFQREVGITFLASQANGNIGEIVLGYWAGSALINAWCRTTFDPMIVKDSSKRLKFGVTFTASRVAA